MVKRKDVSNSHDGSVNPSNNSSSHVMPSKWVPALLTRVAIVAGGFLFLARLPTPSKEWYKSSEFMYRAPRRASPSLLPTFPPWVDGDSGSIGEDKCAGGLQRLFEEITIHNHNADTVMASMCQCLPQWTTTLVQNRSTSAASTSTSIVSNLWNHYLKPQLQQAAYDSLADCYGSDYDQEGTFPRDDFHNWTERMFSALTHYRLKKSLKVPAHPFVMEKLAHVLLRRIAYLQTSQNSSNTNDSNTHRPTLAPPLKIAVLGGSVTEGCGSSRNTLGLPHRDLNCQKRCTWTAKLERLLNHILGDDAVIIQNYAVGGSDSGIGSTLLEFDLWHDDLEEDDNTTTAGHDFDIFITAYGPNDGRSPMESRDFLYESMQRLVRLAQEQRPCSDLPLVIQLEDTMLDTAVNDNVLNGLWYGRSMVETANWVGSGSSVMAISYADAIRDYTYGHPVEDWTVNEYDQVHPGLSFHTGLAWVVAYNLLSGLVVDACEALSMPEHGHAEPRHGVPLPILTQSLASHNVGPQWNQTTMEKREYCANQAAATSDETDPRQTNKNMCVYKWIAARQSASTREMVHQAVARVATHIDGWEATGFPIRKPKRTWEATKPNATFTTQLDNIESAVNKMLVLVSCAVLVVSNTSDVSCIVTRHSAHPFLSLFIFSFGRRHLLSFIESIYYHYWR